MVVDNVEEEWECPMRMQPDSRRRAEPNPEHMLPKSYDLLVTCFVTCCVIQFGTMEQGSTKLIGAM